MSHLSDIWCGPGFILAPVQIDESREKEQSGETGEPMKADE